MAKSSGTNPEHQAVFTIRIDRSKLARLHEIAESQERTAVAHIRMLINREIAEHDEEREAA